MQIYCAKPTHAAHNLRLLVVAAEYTSHQLFIKLRMLKTCPCTHTHMMPLCTEGQLNISVIRACVLVAFVRVWSNYQLKFPVEHPSFASYTHLILGWVRFVICWIRLICICILSTRASMYSLDEHILWFAIEE